MAQVNLPLFFLLAFTMLNAEQLPIKLYTTADGRPSNQKRRGFEHGRILGHLMAHELGHLMLGVGSHSARGIMHVPWHIEELEIISQGLMLFEPSEGKRMRTNIRARGGLQQGSLPLP